MDAAGLKYMSERIGKNKRTIGKRNSKVREEKE